VDIDIICDGCEQDIGISSISFVKALGHIMRYCPTCLEHYAAFKTACEAEGARMQRLLDLFEQDIRTKVPLKLTPLDLPRLVTDGKGEALTLG
jgi:hypothetical protein